jgi:hypothetical protein
VYRKRRRARCSVCKGKLKTGPQPCAFPMQRRGARHFQGPALDQRMLSSRKALKSSLTNRRSELGWAMDSTLLQPPFRA